MNKVKITAKVCIIFDFNMKYHRLISYTFIKKKKKYFFTNDTSEYFQKIKTNIPIQICTFLLNLRKKKKNLMNQILPLITAHSILSNKITYHMHITCKRRITMTRVTIYNIISHKIWQPLWRRSISRTTMLAWTRRQTTTTKRTTLGYFDWYWRIQYVMGTLYIHTYMYKHVHLLSTCGLSIRG